MNILRIALLAMAILSNQASVALENPATVAKATDSNSSASNGVKQLVVPDSVGAEVFTADPVSVVFGLFLIVFLILAVAWMLRRMGAVPMIGNQTMKVVAGLSVGTREKVMLIEVGGKQILVGVAPGRVSPLHYFDEPVVESRGASESEFSLKFKQLFQQGMKHNAGERADKKSV
jgi:flagellar protein FliO/FliZ